MKTKAFILVLAAALLSSNSMAAQDSTQGDISTEVVVFTGSGHPHRLIDVQPEGWYYRDTRMLTVEFPATGFVPYTLSVSSAYATVDYFVTTPLTSVYISPDVVHVDLQLETDDGDIFYGSFEATSGTLSQ